MFSISKLDGVADRETFRTIGFEVATDQYGDRHMLQVVETYDGKRRAVLERGLPPLRHFGSGRYQTTAATFLTLTVVKVCAPMIQSPDGPLPSELEALMCLPGAKVK